MFSHRPAATTDRSAEASWYRVVSCPAKMRLTTFHASSSSLIVLWLCGPLPDEVQGVLAQGLQRLFDLGEAGFNGARG
jgi:hypothetical protein